MKLELTYTEASKLIRYHFNLNDDVKIVITDVPSDRPDDPAILALIQDINGMDWLGGQKIQAIKHFREKVPCGLAEAKWAVENWQHVRAWMKEKGHLPKFEGSYSDGTIRLV
jgi:hypothetical protein